MKTNTTAFVFSWFVVGLIAPTAFAHDETHDRSHAMAQKAGPFGQPGLTKNVTRTIAVGLTDAMRFSPAAVTVKRGETVRLHITNTGKIPHEFVLGTKEDIDAHAEMMRQMPGMVHTDASSVRVAPGKSADIIWQFSAAGKFVFACLIPGHREAGMQGAVTVIEQAKR